MSPEERQQAAVEAKERRARQIWAGHLRGVPDWRMGIYFGLWPGQVLDIIEFVRREQGEMPVNEIALIEGELALDPEVEAELAPRAERIRSLVNVARSCIIEVGRELIEAREDIPHGQWLPWLRHEFQWSRDTAANYIRVAEAFQIPNSSEFPAFNISARALYALAAPGIPQTVRDAAVQAAVEGGHITEAEAEKLIAEHVAKALEAQREELDATLHEREDEYLGRIDALKENVTTLQKKLRAAPTIEDAVELFRKLTGKRKLSARQY